jgi:hypothetical protein
MRLRRRGLPGARKALLSCAANALKRRSSYARRDGLGAQTCASSASDAYPQRAHVVMVATIIVS